MLPKIIRFQNLIDLEHFMRELNEEVECFVLDDGQSVIVSKSSIDDLKKGINLSKGRDIDYPIPMDDALLINAIKQEVSRYYPNYRFDFFARNLKLNELLQFFQTLNGYVGPEKKWNTFSNALKDVLTVSETTEIIYKIREDATDAERLCIDLIAEITDETTCASYVYQPYIDNEGHTFERNFLADYLKNGDKPCPLDDKEILISVDALRPNKVLLDVMAIFLVESPMLCKEFLENHTYHHLFEIAFRTNNFDLAALAITYFENEFQEALDIDRVKASACHFVVRMYENACQEADQNYQDHSDFLQQMHSRLGKMALISDKKNNLLLHYVADSSQFQGSSIAQFILQLAAVEKVNLYQSNSDHLTPLGIIIEKNPRILHSALKLPTEIFINLIHRLVDARANVEGFDEQGLTALHVAMQHKPDLLPILLRTFDPNIRDQQARPLLIYAAEKNPQAIGLLLQHQADEFLEYQGSSIVRQLPFDCLSESDKEWVVSIFLDKLQQPNADYKKLIEGYIYFIVTNQKVKGLPLFHLLINSCQDNVIEYVISLIPPEQKKYLNECDDGQNTALYVAVQNKRLQLAQPLLALGSNLFHVNNSGENFFDIAVRCDCFDFAKLYLTSTDGLGNTALMRAVVDEKFELAHLIINSTSFFSAVNLQKQNIFHIAAAKGAIDLLLAINERSFFNPLDWMQLDATGRSPIYYLVTSSLRVQNDTEALKFRQLITYLRERKVLDEMPLDNRKNTLWHVVTRETTAEKAELFLADHPVNFVSFDQHGETPLHAALNYRKFEMFAFFLRNGFPVDQVNLAGLVVLHRAIDFGDLRYLAAILNREPNLLVAWQSKSILHRALTNPDLSAALLLTQYLQKSSPLLPLYEREHIFTRLKNMSDEAGRTLYKMVQELLEKHAQQGEIAKISQLLQLNIVNVLDVINDKKETIFHVLLFNDFYAQLQKLKEDVSSDSWDFFCNPLNSDGKSFSSLVKEKLRYCVVEGDLQRVVSLLELNILKSEEIVSLEGDSIFNAVLQKGNFEILNALLNKYPDARALLKESLKSVLVQKGIEGDVSYIDKVLSLKLIEIDTGLNDQGQTLLHQAIMQDQYSVSSFLITAGAKADIPDANSKTALTLVTHKLFDAITRGDLETVKKLFELGLIKNINECFNDINLSLLQVAFKRKKFTICRYLLEKGADPHLSRHDKIPCPNVLLKDYLRKTLSQNSEDVNKTVSYLLEEVIDDPNMSLDSQGNSILHLCVLYRQKQLLQLLLDSYPVDINKGNAEGITALHIALENKDMESACYLLSNGCQLGIKNSQQLTAIDIAIKKLSPSEMLSFIVYHVPKQCDIASKILAELQLRNYDLNRLKKGDKQVPLLSWLIQSNFKTLYFHEERLAIIEFFKTLVTIHKLAVNQPDKDGRTPLHYAVEGEGEGYAFFPLLIEKGAYVNAKDNAGVTPLHVAKEPVIIHALLQAGADPRLLPTLDQSHQTMLDEHIAQCMRTFDTLISSGEKENVQANELVKKYPYLEKQVYEHLLANLKMGSLFYIQRVLEYVDLGNAQQIKNQLLKEAISTQKFEIAYYLMDHDGKLDRSQVVDYLFNSIRQATPITADFIQLLNRLGGHEQVLNATGMTLLQVALEQKQFKNALALKAIGAKADISYSEKCQIPYVTLVNILSPYLEKLNYSENEIATLKDIIALFPDVNYLLNNGRNLLHWAAEKGCLPLLHLLVSDKNIQIDCPTADNKTAFALALDAIEVEANGRLQTVSKYCAGAELLVQYSQDKKAFKNLFDKVGWIEFFSWFLFGERFKNNALVRERLKQEMKDWKLQNAGQVIPMLLWVIAKFSEYDPHQHGDLGAKFVNELLNFIGYHDIGHRHLDNSCLHIAVSHPNKYSYFIILALLRNGADVNAINREGYTPLHLLLSMAPVLDPHPNHVRQLISPENCSLLVAGNDPLRLCAHIRNPEYKELIIFDLLERGVKPVMGVGLDDRIQSFISQKKIAVKKYLEAYFSSPEMETPMEVIAIIKQYPYIFDLYNDIASGIKGKLTHKIENLILTLLHEVNIDTQFAQGVTLAHWAARTNHFSFLERHQYFNFDATIADDAGNIPLHEVAATGLLNNLELLIRNGFPVSAMINKTNLAELSPLDFAVTHGHLECVKVLCLYRDNPTEINLNNIPAGALRNYCQEMNNTIRLVNDFCGYDESVLTKLIKDISAHLLRWNATLENPADANYRPSSHSLSGALTSLFSSHKVSWLVGNGFNDTMDKIAQKIGLANGPNVSFSCIFIRYHLLQQEFARNFKMPALAELMKEHAPRLEAPAKSEPALY